MRAILCVTLVCAAVLSRPATATAQTAAPGDDALADAATRIGAVLSVSLGIGGLVATVVNSIHVARGTRAPVVWRVMGFGYGALTIFGGVLWASGASSEARWAAGSMIALGPVFMGMALWTTLLPEEVAPRRALVTPTVLRGPLGSVGYGLALDIPMI